MRNGMHRERETLEYQEALLSELCRMASEGGQEMLGYLLGMAYLEVCDQLGRPAKGVPRSAVAQRATRN